MRYLGWMVSLILLVALPASTADNVIELTRPGYYSVQQNGSEVAKVLRINFNGSTCILDRNSTDIANQRVTVSCAGAAGSIVNNITNNITIGPELKLGNTTYSGSGIVATNPFNINATGNLTLNVSQVVAASNNTTDIGSRDRKFRTGFFENGIVVGNNSTIYLDNNIIVTTVGAFNISQYIGSVPWNGVLNVQVASRGANLSVADRINFGGNITAVSNASGKGVDVNLSLPTTTFAVISGAGEETTNSAPFTNYTNPNMVLNLTTTGRPIRFTFNILAQSKNNLTYYGFGLFIDGVLEPGTSRSTVFYQNVTTIFGTVNAQTMTLDYIRGNLPAGNHTFYIGHTTLGTGNVTANGANRQFSAVEF